MGKIYCTRCGAELDDSAVFCTGCGAKIEATAETPEPQPIPQPTPPLDPVPDPAPVPAPKPVKGGAGRAVLASVLAVLLSVFALTAGILGTVHARISPNGLADTVRTADISKIDVSDFIEDTESGDTVADYVYEMIDDDFIRDTGLKKSDVQEILDDPGLRDALAEYLSDYTDAILNDERGTVLDGDDILELIEENEDLIDDVVGYRLKDRDYQAIEKELDAFDFEQIAPKEVSKVIEENAPVKMDTIRFGLSATPWIIAIALAVVMAALIGLVYLFRLRPLLGFCGGGLIASGTLLLLAALGGAVVPGILQISAVAELVKPLVGTLLLHGGIQLAAGAVCAVVAGVMKPKTVR